MGRGYLPKRQPLDPCPIERVVALVGGKWKARALYLLSANAFGFAELRRALGPVSQEVLATQLRAMARDGLIVRLEAPAGGGANARYAATAKGRDLVRVLSPVAEWGTRELRDGGQDWRPSPTGIGGRDAPEPSQLPR